MASVIVFGGTTEGRLLCERVSAHVPSLLYAVATAEGAVSVGHLRSLRVLVGRLTETGMIRLFDEERPRLVVDATHPYAVQVKDNIRRACAARSLPVLFVERAQRREDGLVRFPTADALIEWLDNSGKTVFITLGSSYAARFSARPDLLARSWIRVLPTRASLDACLEAGFPVSRIIAMQGPFSEALNLAMFDYAGAEILVTKESGDSGGFCEKTAAARARGMTVAVLEKPPVRDGVSLEEAKARILEASR